MSAWSPSQLAAFVSAALAERANPEDAAPMQAYMKSEMPFYGVKRRGRDEIMRELRPHVSIDTPAAYEAHIRALWALPHREERYLALAIARRHLVVAQPAQLDLFRELIIDGAWWDFVDDLATHMVGPLARRFPAEIWPTVDDWAHDPDMWIRRSAMLSQVGAKEATDDTRLFSHALLLAPEQEFFIRKAIGWALRDRSYTNPDGINTFLDTHWDDLSGLTRREGAKALVRQGLRA